MQINKMCNKETYFLPSKRAWSLVKVRIYILTNYNVFPNEMIVHRSFREQWLIAAGKILGRGRFYSINSTNICVYLVSKVGHLCRHPKGMRKFDRRSGVEGMSTDRKAVWKTKSSLMWSDVQCGWEDPQEEHEPPC